MKDLLLWIMFVLAWLGFWYIAVYPTTEMAHKARAKEWGRKTAPRKEKNPTNKPTSKLSKEQTNGS